MNRADIVIVGAGMAGASLGAELAAGPARGARILLVEMEAQPGYHATGRSVAFWEESYGGPGVQPLTSASGPLLRDPDPALSERPLMTPRGSLHIGRADSAATRDRMLRDFAAAGVDLREVGVAELRERIPGLRADWTVGLAEPGCSDIDVAGLHQACLAMLRRSGGQVLTDARLVSARPAGAGWEVETSAGSIACDILVNAAGAWADDVARSCGVAPIGITPYRRTVVQLRVDPPVTDDLPLILDLEGGFYFKPEGAGRIWLTPHDEVPSVPCDAAPEELAVAEAIHRFSEAVDWRIDAVERKWAGLRSFTPDRLPAYGFDAVAPGFFWFAGQGGFGIQTAPAAAKLGAALLGGTALPPAIAGIDPLPYAARRFHDRRQ